MFRLWTGQTAVFKFWVLSSTSLSIRASVDVEQRTAPAKRLKRKIRL